MKTFEFSTAFFKTTQIKRDESDFQSLSESLRYITDFHHKTNNTVAVKFFQRNIFFTNFNKLFGTISNWLQIAKINRDI